MAPLALRYLAVLLFLVSSFLHAQVFTIEIPAPPVPSAISNVLASHNGDWHWRRGTNSPQTDWQTSPDSGLDGNWIHGQGGFGYGDDEIAGESTRLNGMENVHSTIFIRKEFTVDQPLPANGTLVLTVDYDDGFVAYLDGTEVARRNVPGAIGSLVQHTATTGGTSHEASCCDNPNPPVNIELNTVLVPGNHVLAIIGVNQSIGSSDFHLIAELASVSVQTPTNTPVLANYGTYSLTKSASVTIQGSNTFAGSSKVSLNGDLAEFDLQNGQWSRSLDLQPGANRFYVAAHDSTGNILTNADLLIVREQATLEVGGRITENILWNEPSQIIRVTNNLVVPAGASLEIGSGLVVILQPGTSITATTNGIVRVRGTDGNRALFLPSGEDWGWLRAQGTNALLDIKFGEIVAGQARVHTGGILRIEDSIIRDYPNTGIEVIEAVNGGELTMRRTYMTRFAEGDSSETPVLVEGCLFGRIPRGWFGY